MAMKTTGPRGGDLGPELRVVLWPLLEPVVVQVELLGHLAPIDRVEEEVCSPLVRGRLLRRRDARTRDPDPLVLVEAPVSVVPGKEEKGKVSS